ncbi:kinase-like domain-containing protein [Apiospora rasikravindrae]|uniref:Kinase-like domain-containing protein n=1 Tax=Apiospora rasikravindrae TaxID=990691 RepID=A0ABR1U7Z4_9PEZI
MAYREQFEDASETTKEFLPSLPTPDAPKQPPGTLSQMSMKSLNVLVGDLIPGDVEHDLVPLLKLIDFGRGIQHDPKHEVWGEKVALFYNLGGVGEILSDMLHPVRESQDGWIEYVCAANEVFDRNRRIRTTAEREMLMDSSIDPALCDLIAYFLSIRPRYMPDLYEAMEMCMHGCANIRASISPLNSDEAIRDLVQRLIFDAEFNGARFTFEYEDKWDEYDMEESQEEEEDQQGEGQQDQEMKDDENKGEGTKDEENQDENTMMETLKI